MKKLLFALPVVLPVLVAAGCSSNTTAPVDTAVVSKSTSTSNTTTTQIDKKLAAEGVATPFIANAGASSTRNAAEPSSAPPVPVVTPNGGAAPADGAAPQPKMPQVPPGMKMGANMTLTPTKEMDAQIAALQKGDKKKLAQAYADRGTFRMNDNAASPRVKYRAALADYRAALQADPNNAEAKANKKLIESIYTSMGLPIPQ